MFTGGAGAQLELLDDDVDFLDVLLNSDLQASNGPHIEDPGLPQGQLGSANTTQAGNDFVELSLTAMQEAEPCGPTAPTEVLCKTAFPGGTGEARSAGQPTPPISVHAVTCLHADEHAQPCTLCTEAPEDFASTELVGQVGRRNGNKLLRSRITKTREWADPSERKKVSRVAREQGLTDLADSLENGRGGDLCKEELLFLARQWGFRSNIWRRRKSIAAKPAGARTVLRGDGAAPVPAAAAATTAADAVRGLGVSTGDAAKRGGLSAETSARCSSGSGAPMGSGPEAEGTTSIWGSGRGTAPSIQQDASVPNAAASVMLMDRTAVTQDFDRPTLMLALQHNTIRRLHDIGERAIQIHSTAGPKCEKLIKAGAPCFVTEDTSKNIAASIRTGEVVNEIASRLHSFTFASVIDAQALGPRQSGESVEARLLSGSDLSVEAVLTKGRDSFREIRDLIIRIQARGFQAQRVASHEAIGDAQKCWEDGYVQSYTAHIEMLNLFLDVLEIARRDSSSRDPYLTYLQIATNTLTFFVSYNPRTLGSHIVRKRWVDSVLASRRMEAGACLDGSARALPLPAQFAAGSSWDHVTAAAVAGLAGDDASKAPTLRLLNLATGTAQALPRLC